jgi:protein-disulfide isomerase
MPASPAVGSIAARPTAQRTKGSPNAPVTIHEFAEFYCPFCALHLWETLPRIERDYIDAGLVRYEFHHLVVHGAPALLASAATECARKQGRFWALHDRLFDRIFPDRNLEQAQVHDLDQLRDAAGTVGLDVAELGRCLDAIDAKLESCQVAHSKCTADGGDPPSCDDGRNHCMRTNEAYDTIAEDGELLGRLIEALPADERAQVERVGTPTFFINGHVLVGAQPYEEFKMIIDRELEHAKRE